MTEPPQPPTLSYASPTGRRRLSFLAVVSPMVTPAVLAVGLMIPWFVWRATFLTVGAALGLALPILARWRLARRRDLWGEWFANAGLIVGGAVALLVGLLWITAVSSSL